MYGAEELLKISDQLWFSMTMRKTVLMFVVLAEVVGDGNFTAVGEVMVACTGLVVVGCSVAGAIACRVG